LLFRQIRMQELKLLLYKLQYFALSFPKVFIARNRNIYYSKLIVNPIKIHT